MKNYLKALGAISAIVLTMSSCSVIDRMFEDKVRISATVLTATAPRSTTIRVNNIRVGGGSARTRINAGTTIISQEITVRREDTGMVAAGTITLSSYHDRVYTGDQGFALIGVKTGSVHKFECIRY